MYNSGLILLSCVIAVYWLMKRNHMLGKKIELVLAASIIAGALISVLPVLLQYADDYSQNNSDFAVWKYFFFVMMLLVIGSMMFLIWGVVKGASILVYNFRKESSLTVNYDESKLYLDGYVSFKADLNVWLAHGFIKTSIETPFGKTIDILSYNDGNKKKGNLKGKFNESIHWKWQIPSEFSDGKCKVSISLYDGSIMWIFQKPELVLTKTYDVTIERWKSDPSYIC